MQGLFSYGKKEKLKSRKLAENLFNNGKTFTVFPIKVFYLLIDETLNFPLKTGVGAAKKNFKQAVQRNRIKRLLREAYRKEKFKLIELLNQENKQAVMFLLYVDTILPDYKSIEEKMPLIIDQLMERLK